MALTEVAPPGNPGTYGDQHGGGSGIASGISVADADGNYSSSNVEGVLAEVGASLATNAEAIEGVSSNLSALDTRVDALETDDIPSTRITQGQVTWTDTPTIDEAADVQGLLIKGNAATAKSVALPSGIAADVAFSFACIGVGTFTFIGDATAVLVTSGGVTVYTGGAGDGLPVPTGRSLVIVSEGSNTWRLYATPAEIRAFSISFNPKAVCDGTIDRLFLMNVPADAFPSGIKIRTWYLSFDADPTTEVDLDLKRADAFIGVANSAVMDVLDTTNGASSETTAANINGGATIAAGKVIYLEFGTAYSTDSLQITFTMTYQAQ